MTRRSREPLRVCAGGQPFVCRGASLLLSDRGDDVNLPLIEIAMVALAGRPRVPVRLIFQRSRVRHEPPAEQAAGLMDTIGRWTVAHHAEVWLSTRAVPAPIEDAPFAIPLFDRVRWGVSRRIARAIRAHGLGARESDLCLQVVVALEILGVDVDPRYLTRAHGDASVPLAEVTGLGGNRAAEAAAAQRRAVIPSAA